MSRRVLLVIMAVCLVAATGWWFMRTSEAAPVEFGELCPVDARDVGRLVMRDGSTGEASCSVRTDDIEAVFEALNATEFRPQGRSEQAAGWTLVVDLYDSEDSYFRVQFQGQKVKTMEMTARDGIRGAVRSFEMDDEPGVMTQLFEIHGSLQKHWH